jgi:hypothetical protein
MNTKWLNENNLHTAIIEKNKCNEEIRELHKIRIELEQLECEYAQFALVNIYKRLNEILYG